MASKVTPFITIDIHCSECKGTCWNSKDNSATQLAAKEKFGLIPNPCVNSENGTAHCPYATN